jgi:hypothetical protein
MRPSENSVKAKFAEFTFHALGLIVPVRYGEPEPMLPRGALPED